MIINKWIDPVLAVAVGVAAYALYEKQHPRAKGHGLSDLIKRRYLKGDDA